MKIEFIKIKNFRKLHTCKIEFSDKETIFVGANNSGKTTAMEALITFLKRKEFKTQDFTICHWTELNRIAETWVTNATLKDEDKSIKLLEPFLPSLDLWINIENSELRYVSHLIPTLDWEGGILGVRLIFQPKNLDALIEEYIVARTKISKLRSASRKKIELWPENFSQFCDRKLNSLFEIKTYILDPKKCDEDQELSEHNIALDGNPLNGLIKIDTINAQRGFSDVNSDNPESQSSRNLSSQLRSYYDKHLNPSIDPTEKDLDALDKLNKAQLVFDGNLKTRFKDPLDELGELNYPGFGNPQITLSSLIKAADGLEHESAVRYEINKGLTLPEKYNGLGYQNLISIIFKLMRYRDEWMRKGKETVEDDDTIEPLHLVLVEEPEAHLHAQVQQVFIKKAYSVLRNHPNLSENKELTTQLIISTHSSYIAHQKFESLRYFKRSNYLKIPTSEVVSLKSVFDSSKSKEKETEKFVIRYLTTTHNDLFFADAVILVEGPAERMLIPHFIKNNHQILDSSYVTILEIGGSHAHRLQPLIEKLGVVTLIITDIDSQVKSPDNSSTPPKERFQKCQPMKGNKQETNNDTLKIWIPKLIEIDKLLNLSFRNKVLKHNPIRVCFQNEININGQQIYPYTFEDALVLENIEVFKSIDHSSGLLKKMVTATAESDIRNTAKKAYEAIIATSAKKAEFALDVMYLKDPEKLNTPKYIEEGLKWVEDQLKSSKNISSN